MNLSNKNDTPSLDQVRSILLRRKWTMLLVFVSILGASAIYTSLLPKQYSTRLKILVKNERADTIVSAERSGPAGVRGEVSESEINSEIQLLDSNNLLRRIVLKCGLDEVKQTGGADRSVAIERGMKRLQKNLKISPVRKANVIQVEYSDTDPKRAVTVLNALADLYLEEHLKVHGTPGTYEFFKGQAERYQGELKDIEAKVATYRRQENIVMLAQQKDELLRKSTESEAAMLQTEASAREYDRKINDNRAQLAAAQPRIVTQLRTTTNQYSVERLHTMLVELRNRRTQLLAKFQPDDRMVEEVDQEITDTQAALDRITKLTSVDQATDVNPLHQALQIEASKQQTELAGLQSRRDELKQQTAHYRGQLIHLAEATAAYEDLLRAQKEAEDNYLLYSKKTEEARIAESLDRQKIANVAIAETPLEPQLPSKPNVYINLALGFILASVLSICSPFVVEYLRNSVDQPAELEDLTGLPVLAESYGD